jgi:hypothetical protein
MFRSLIVIRLFAYTPSIKFVGPRSKISQQSHTPVTKPQQQTHSSLVS